MTNSRGERQEEGIEGKELVRVKVDYAVSLDVQQEITCDYTATVRLRAVRQPGPHQIGVGYAINRLIKI